MRYTIVILLAIGISFGTWLLVQGQSGSSPETGKAPTARKPIEPVTVVQNPNLIRLEGGIEIHIDGKDDRIVIDGEVIGGQSRPLEFLVVTPGGEVHEALLRVQCRPWDVRQAMELLGLRCGTKKLRFQGDPTMPEGAAVELTVEWKKDDGSMRSVPIEDWVFNTVTRTTMERGPWIFTGSVETPAIEGQEPNELLADHLGRIVALWRDPACIIDNPRDSATDDMAYRPNTTPGMIPEAGTPVRLIIRPHRATKEQGTSQGR